MCACAQTCVFTSVSWCASGGWRTIWGNWFSSFITWVVELKVTASSLASSTFAHWATSTAPPSKKTFFFKPENHPFLYFSKCVNCLRTKAFAFSSYWAHFSGVLGQLAEHLSLLAIVTLSSATLVAPLQTDAALLMLLPAFPTRTWSKGSDVFIGVESNGWQKASALHFSVRSLLVSLVPAWVFSHWSHQFLSLWHLMKAALWTSSHVWATFQPCFHYTM